MVLTLFRFILVRQPESLRRHQRLDDGMDLVSRWLFLPTKAVFVFLALIVIDTVFVPSIVTRSRDFASRSCAPPAPPAPVPPVVLSLCR